jgi:hypothetical protein
VNDGVERTFSLAGCFDEVYSFEGRAKEILSGVGGVKRLMMLNPSPSDHSTPFCLIVYPNHMCRALNHEGANVLGRECSSAN